MIILRQKNYSKTSKMIKGALIAAPVGYVAGTIIGSKKGREKASKEEKEVAAKDRIDRNEKQIKEYKKAIQDTKKELKKEIDPIEKDMKLDEIDYLKRDINSLEKKNKILRSGNYDDPTLADDTPTGEKYITRGQGLGTIAGVVGGATIGYGLHKILKK